MRKPTLLPDIRGIYSLTVFATLVLFGGGKALECADTLWHIRAGQEMLTQGRILDVDVFSHTAFGKPWIAHEWLSEIIMASVHHFAGLAGVVFFYFLLVAATFWFLFETIRLRTGSEWLPIVSAGSALLLGYTHLLARPHIFTWLFIAITLNVLTRGEKKHFYLLPPVTAIWANLHGGFLFGLLVQGFFLLGAMFDDRPRPFSFKTFLARLQNYRFPAVILIASIISSGFNPFGYHLLLFPFQVNEEVFLTGISEWGAPNMRELWFYRFYILLLLILILMKKRRPATADILLLLFFIDISLKHIRHVSIAGLVLAPVLAELMKPHLPQRQETAGHLKMSPITGPAAVLTLFSSAMLLLGNYSSLGKTVAASLFPLPEDFSRGAVEFITTDRPPGNMLNEYALGGFLLYSLRPPQKVFIDGRADMYGAKIFSDYGKMAKMEKGAQDLLEKYQIEWIIFPNDSAIIKQLSLTGSWKTEFTDEHVTILVADHKERLAQK